MMNLLLFVLLPAALASGFAAGVFRRRSFPSSVDRYNMAQTQIF
jgi:hypothetical protein